MPVNRPRRGFTLTELLIAIGIIVLLIGLLLPVVTKVRMSAYGASTASQISALMTAIEQYHNDFSAYPGPLPLNQINYAVSSTDPSYKEPFVVDPTGAPQKLIYSPTAPTVGASTFNLDQISGSENLILGLLGGLKVINDAGSVTFVYDPTAIYSLVGLESCFNSRRCWAVILNINLPKTHPAYYTCQGRRSLKPVRSQRCQRQSASFADPGGRAPKDTIIPVFVDKYPDSMPILYMRAQRSAAGLVSFAGCDKSAGTSLANDVGGTITSWQYDLREIYPYTNSDGTPSTSNIGLSNKAKINLHGLQKVWVTSRYGRHDDAQRLR